MHEQQQQGDPRELALERAINEQLPISNGPHVWIGSLADYEAGRPTGRWLSANQSAAALEQDIDYFVAGSRAGGSERFAWRAFAQHGFGRHPPSTSDTLPRIVELARRAREEVRAFNAWADLGTDTERWLNRFYDAYLGRYDQFRDWLNIEVDHAGWDKLLDRVIPSEIRMHVDLNLDSLGHELRSSGAVLTAPDPTTRGIFVFANLADSSSI